jgi:hypothetical protein
VPWRADAAARASPPKGREVSIHATLPRLAAAALAACTTATAAAAETLGVSEVRAGQRGVCVTEMDGGEMVEFPVTVLGTTGAAAPEGELVLVRLEDERFRHAGIIAGMSGSPVYVDGRLLGAVAFGWAFSKDPIAGVTPFERMVELRDAAAAGPASPSATAAGMPTGVRPAVAELASAVHAAEVGAKVLGWLAPEPAGELRGLPLVVGAPGLGELRGWLSESFRRLGLVGAPAGGGGATTIASEEPLRPGGMVAGVLVDGDAAVSVGGTVTEVRGDDVWAFGHMVFGAGEIELPLARAEVVTVLPSQLQSFKFFRTGDIVGAFRADRQHGSWGRLGAEAAMLPVRVSVDERDYRFRSVRHDVLTPLLVAYLTQAGYAARGRTFGGQTVGLEIAVGLEDGRTAELEQWFVGGDAAAEASAYAAAVLAYLTTSGFERPAPSAVEVRLATRETLDALEVVDAVPDRWTVAPGEQLEVRVRLRPRRGPERLERLRIEVPERVPEGRLDLVVADGASWSAYDLRMRPPRPASFGDELRLLERLEPASRLVAALERPEPGVAMGSGALPVPAGVALQLKAGLGPNLAATAWGVVGRVRWEADGPVSGAVRIALEVDAAAGDRR